ncbi:isoprenoid synthase domain-containing protein [Pisolithus croceorrhizus]|nr:isoprenoid synthase domain-containing protein [Pisolithus croceorrhizus]
MMVLAISTHTFVTNIPHLKIYPRRSAYFYDLLGPFTYVASNPGKDIRGTLIAAFNIWLNVPKPKLDVITRVIDAVHNASLMSESCRRHIEDDSDLRRGKPAAHKVYGIPQTINSASYAWWLAFQQLASIQGSPKEIAELDIPDRLTYLLSGELLNLHRGQGLDIFWPDTFGCPTEQEYIQMARGSKQISIIGDRTEASSILRLSIKIMMAFATTNTDVNYVGLIDLLGIYGQVRDDYMNLQSTEYTDAKGLADDISEGKFSKARKHFDNGYHILRQRPKTPTLKHHAIAYLRDTTHSIDYTLSVMRSLRKQIREETTKLGGNPILETLLEKLHQ